MMGFRHPVESVSMNSAVFNFARENIAPYFDMYERENGHVTKKGVPIPQPQEQPLIIGNDVWVGNNCTFRGGITIHTGAVIASNSVVLKDVPPYAVVAGIPAQIKKFRFPPEIIHGLLESRWWDYELGDMYREKLDFSSPKDFLDRFSIVKGNLRKFAPKPFVPIVEFGNAEFKEQHGSLITCWGNMLNVSKEDRLVHKDKLGVQVKIIDANKFVYRNRKSGVDVVLTGKNTGMLDEAAKFEVVKNVDASISIKVGKRYLSARPNGEVSLVEENRDWEHFYVIR